MGEEHTSPSFSDMRDADEQFVMPIITILMFLSWGQVGKLRASMLKEFR